MTVEELWRSIPAGAVVCDMTGRKYKKVLARDVYEPAQVLCLDNNCVQHVTEHFYLRQPCDHPVFGMLHGKRMRDWIAKSLRLLRQQNAAAKLVQQAQELNMGY